MLKYLCMCDRCGKEEVIADKMAIQDFFPSPAMDWRFCVTCEKSRAELDERLRKSNDDALEAWLIEPKAD